MSTTVGRTQWSRTTGFVPAYRVARSSTSPTTAGSAATYMVRSPFEHSPPARRPSSVLSRNIHQPTAAAPTKMATSTRIRGPVATR